MTRRKKKEPQGPSVGTPLTSARLALAHEIAKRGLALLLPEAELIRTIVEQCKTTERSAAAAVRTIVKQGAKLSPQEREQLRDVLHFRYEALYATLAQDGKAEAAAKMLDRRARLDGLFTVEKDRNKPETTTQEDEFAGRTKEELDHYARTGHFPGEQQSAVVVPIDPLARLKKKQA